MLQTNLLKEKKREIFLATIYSGCSSVKVYLQAPEIFLSMPSCLRYGTVVTRVKRIQSRRTLFGFRRDSLRRPLTARGCIRLPVHAFDAVVVAFRILAYVRADVRSRGVLTSDCCVTIIIAHIYIHIRALRT